MNQPTLVFAGTDVPPLQNRIYLIDAASAAGMDSLLSADERVLLKRALESDIKSFYVPRAEGLWWIRILKQEALTAEALEDTRLAGAELAAQLRQFNVEAVSLESPGARAQQVLAFAEGMALGSYQFTRHFSQPDKKEASPKLIQLRASGLSPEEISEFNYVLEAVFLTRDLVNEPHSHFTAEDLAQAARAAGERCGFSTEILGKEQIQTLRMGGILAVNQAGAAPPQFCILEYKPETAQNEAPIVLVGKGIVYDTGGLSLKSSEGMETMKCDMAGAGAVIGALCAVARNRLPIHVVGLIPATDNKIGERALAPGDVIRMYSGKTVEVVNTDAEGRLILADALHYAKKLNPELVIDLATLTGAAVRALGTQAICYMGVAPVEVKKSLEACGWDTYERLVELPLWREYGEELKSPVADLRNLGSPLAGMITAGKFLEHFTDYPWLHLDIAGTAYLRQANGYRTKEGTGVGVRLLYQFLKKRSSAR
ncbi:MAG: leucyl aminopeptidase family protein [Saprospiraceae bacterium]